MNYCLKVSTGPRDNYLATTTVLLVLEPTTAGSLDVLETKLRVWFFSSSPA